MPVATPAVVRAATANIIKTGAIAALCGYGLSGIKHLRDHFFLWKLLFIIYLKQNYRLLRLVKVLGLGPAAGLGTVTVLGFGFNKYLYLGTVPVYGNISHKSKRRNCNQNPQIVYLGTVPVYGTATNNKIGSILGDSPGLWKPLFSICLKQSLITIN
jgi:hypothetical protein